LIVQSEPCPPVVTQGTPHMNSGMGCVCQTMHSQPITCWDRLTIRFHDKLTWADIKRQLEEEYGVDVISMVSETREYDSMSGTSGDMLDSARASKLEQIEIEAEKTADLSCVLFPLIRVL
jgi:hypothetical protein